MHQAVPDGGTVPEELQVSTFEIPAETEVHRHHCLVAVLGQLHIFILSTADGKCVVLLRVASADHIGKSISAKGRINLFTSPRNMCSKPTSSKIMP